MTHSSEPNTAYKARPGEGVFADERRYLPETLKDALFREKENNSQRALSKDSGSRQYSPDFSRYPNQVPNGRDSSYDATNGPVPGGKDSRGSSLLDYYQRKASSATVPNVPEFYPRNLSDNEPSDGALRSKMQASYEDRLYSQNNGGNPRDGRMNLQAGPESYGAGDNSKQTSCKATAAEMGQTVSSSGASSSNEAEQSGTTSGSRPAASRDPNQSQMQMSQHERDAYNRQRGASGPGSTVASSNGIIDKNLFLRFFGFFPILLDHVVVVFWY